MESIKINVLIVAANGLGKSGVPNVIYQVVKCLSPFANIDIVVFNDEDYYYDKMIDCGANIIRVDEKAPNKKIQRLFWRLFKERNIHRKIFKKIFSDKQYDVIHSFKEYDSAYIFELADQYNIKKRIIHCNNEIFQTSNIISNIVFYHKKRLIKKYITDLIGVSNSCCKISYPGLDYTVLFNSYNENKFNSTLPKLLKDDELVLTQVATFSTRKNQLFSLDVIKLLLDIIPNAKLNLVGIEVEKGYQKQIEEKIEHLDLSGCVSIIDGSSDVCNVLERTSFLLLPSLSEAAPITPVEAQACGISCFSSNYVTQDVNCGGITYLELSPMLWSEKISELFNSVHNERKKFNLQRFSKREFEKELLLIYNINH